MTTTNTQENTFIETLQSRYYTNKQGKLDASSLILSNDAVIKSMIESGVLQNVPLSLLENPERQCLKTFSSLSKFYSHLRIHTNEKPYVCHYKGCNQ